MQIAFFLFSCKARFLQTEGIAKLLRTPSDELCTGALSSYGVAKNGMSGLCTSLCLSKDAIARRYKEVDALYLLLTEFVKQPLSGVSNRYEVHVKGVKRTL